MLSAVLIAVSGGCTEGSENKAAKKELNNESEKIIGVWVSYSELNSMLAGDFITGFSALLKSCKEIGITDLFVHIRAFCDSVYPSEIFPMSAAAEGYNGDLLSDMIRLCHNESLRFHAWINPYRVRTADENINALPENSPARRWLQDDTAENDINVCFSNGIYLNPASAEVRKTVIAGIREIINRYKPDGIHFDDYFYPTSAAVFDESSYAAYTASTSEPLPLEAWRRAQVNSLISGCYTAIKFCDKDIIFSISPAASIEKNRSSMFADIPAWLEAGCVDWIIPQLYFGFEYPDAEFGFERLLEEWKGLERNTARLIIGLAAYKLGTAAEPDAAEWGDNPEILSRQLGISLSKADGAAFFSSSSLFSEEQLNRSALELIENEIALVMMRCHNEAWL